MKRQKEKFKIQLESEVQVSGVIEIAAYDLDGSILAVKVVSNFESYLIEDNNLGNRLLKQVGSFVQLIGHTFIEDRTKMLRVAQIIDSTQSKFSG